MDTKNVRPAPAADETKGDAGAQQPPASTVKADANSPAAVAATEAPVAEEPKGDAGGTKFICIQRCTHRLRHFDVGATFISEPGEVIPPWFEKVE